MKHYLYRLGVWLIRRYAPRPFHVSCRWEATEGGWQHVPGPQACPYCYRAFTEPGRSANVCQQWQWDVRFNAYMLVSRNPCPKCEAAGNCPDGNCHPPAHNPRQTGGTE